MNPFSLLGTDHGRLGTGADVRIPGASWSSPWIVKVQAPLDTSADSAGGIGRMTPDTLLLHDQSMAFLYFVPEEMTGHSTLLRATLRNRQQIAFLWAEQLEGWNTLRVYTEVMPEPGDW